MSHNLAIITTIYQNYTVLEDFLHSLEKQINTDFRLFISDLSQDKKKVVTKLPFTLIPGENLGYAHGVNLALKKALSEGFEKFAVMNNDIYFEDSFIENVSRSLDQHPSALIGGKIYYAKGYEYHKNRYPKNQLGHVIWYAGGQVDWNHALTNHRGVDTVDTHQFDTLSSTDFITGCFMAFDKKVIDKVGLWDEDYFLYFEDADYCVRAKRKHIELVYDPSIVLWHKNAQSTGGAGSDIHQKYQTQNRFKFGLKYAPLKTKAHLLKNVFLSRTKR